MALLHQEVRLDNKNGLLQAGIDNLRGDLKTLYEQLDHGQPTSLNILVSIERQASRLLRAISPEIRRAIAEGQRYAETPKIGDAE